MITQAGYPGSGMVPPPAALISLLTLKLLDKERRSHITDFDFDEVLGLFAGLNVLPKKSYATDYSYRTTRSCQQSLLSRWVTGLAPLLFPDAQEFCLDFHSIPFRGEPEALENHYLPLRGKLRRLNNLPAGAWRRAVIDIPKRRHKNIRYLDETVTLRGYPEKLRQVAVAGLGREEPTLCLSNNSQVSARELITRYVKRNGVEDALGITAVYSLVAYVVEFEPGPLGRFGGPCKRSEGKPL
jgi:hypothetical protein